jgi:hypothetical protein
LNALVNQFLLLKRLLQLQVFLFVFHRAQGEGTEKRPNEKLIETEKKTPNENLAEQTEVTTSRGKGKEGKY